jgi:hypothetical protein
MMCGEGKCDLLEVVYCIYDHSVNTEVNSPYSPAAVHE